MERGDVADDVIRRHHQQRIAATTGCNRGERDRRRSVAAHGLEYQRLGGGCARIGELLLDQIGMARIGYDDRRRVTLTPRAARRQLQHRLGCRERQHLLGHFGPRHGPQACA